MKHLSLPALLLLIPSSALAQDDPDLDVVGGVGMRAYDADWAPDGSLAIAMSRPGQGGDEVILAKFEPAAPIPYKELARWTLPSSTLCEQVAVVVPDRVYGDDEHDRMYAALSLSSTPAPGQVLHQMRLASVPLSGLGVLRVTGPTSTSLERPYPAGSVAPPAADACVAPSTRGYEVRIAWNWGPIQAPYVVLSRTLDQGASLERFFFGWRNHSRPAIAHDYELGLTLYAGEPHDDEGIDVVRVDFAREDSFIVDRTPRDGIEKFRPRIGAQGGRLNITCLSGPGSQHGGYRLRMYTCTYDSLGRPQAPYMTEQTRLSDVALTPGDVEVRGTRIYIVALERRDGSSSGAPKVWEGRRENLPPLFLYTQTYVNDVDEPHGLPPRAAATPENTQPDVRGYVFLANPGTGREMLRADP
jgi:hypothetical protein